MNGGIGPSFAPHAALHPSLPGRANCGNLPFTQSQLAPKNCLSAHCYNGSMTNDNDRPHASKREMHELLYGQLKDCFDGLVSYEFRHATILLVIGGWAITSQHAQSMVAMHWPVTACVILFILALTLVHAGWAIHQYRRSDALYRALSEVAYMPMDYIAPRIIRKGLMRSFCLFHGFASILLCLIILSFATQWHLT
jgi:hypothetical protein